MKKKPIYLEYLYVRPQKAGQEAPEKKKDWRVEQRVKNLLPPTVNRFLSLIPP